MLSISHKCLNLALGDAYHARLDKIFLVAKFGFVSREVIIL